MEIYNGAIVLDESDVYGLSARDPDSTFSMLGWSWRRAWLSRLPDVESQDELVQLLDPGILVTVMRVIGAEPLFNLAFIKCGAICSSRTTPSGARLLNRVVWDEIGVPTPWPARART